MQRRNLKAERLPPTGRQNRQAILPLQNGVDRLELKGPKVGIAPILFEK